MTSQEQQLIDGLLERIKTTSLADKDTEADQYIHRALASNPDALYILAQTVLVQQYGLNSAQQQIADLQQQLGDLQQQLEADEQHIHDLESQPRKSGSFLGKLLGGDQPNQAPPPSSYQPVNTGYPPPQYAPGTPYAQQPPAYGQPVVYAQPGYAAPSGPMGGGSSFLGGALQTAAGVAAGEMAFQGLESLFHGFGGEEHHEEHGFAQSNQAQDSSLDNNFYNPEHDASREGRNDDSGFHEDTANDFSDGGSFDDSSNFDDNSGNDDTF